MARLHPLKQNLPRIGPVMLFLLAGVGSTPSGQGVTREAGVRTAQGRETRGPESVCLQLVPA